MLIFIFDALFHNIVDFKSGHITRKVKITKSIALILSLLNMVHLNSMSRI